MILPYPAGIIYTEKVCVRPYYLCFSISYLKFSIDTFICDTCEALQHTNGYSHSNAHDLVRCQSLALNDDIALSKKERLENLEERFVTVEKELRHLDLEDQLGKVQELLSSMLEKTKN